MIEDVLRRWKSKVGEHPSSLLDERSVIAAYARWAPVYDLMFGALTWAGRRTVTRVVNAGAPGGVLEAGVGTGMSLDGYDRGHRVVGIDLSPDMLKRAKQRVVRRGFTHVESLKLMDAANLAMDDRSFDTVVAMFVMTVVPEPHRVLSEFARVTRPGGRIILVNHFAAERGSRAWLERGLARFSPKIGWKPDFPLSRVTGRPDLKLIEKRRVAPLGLFTLLVFERL